MNRIEEVLKHIDRSKRGIEIAPYFRPILPKATHANVLTLDVFDTTALKQHAHTDEYIPAEAIKDIEDVDIVADACGIGQAVAEHGLKEQIEFIISSHNFEHLPNPIKFLKGCSDTLAPGGVLAMIVPDCRACFDHFRYPTRLSDWLTAWKEDRQKPSAGTMFDNFSVRSRYKTAENMDVGCSFGEDDPERFTLIADLAQAFAFFEKAAAPDAPYMDAHCSTFFPESLELMLRDLNALALVDLEVLEVSQTFGLEFFVHLRKPVTQVQDIASRTRQHREKREALLVDISRKIGRSFMQAVHDERRAERQRHDTVQAASDRLEQALQDRSGAQAGDGRSHSFLGYDIPTDLAAAAGCDPAVLAQDALHHHRVLRKWIDLSPDDRIVEIGCGVGGDAIALTTFLTTGTYTGIDTNAASIAWLRDTVASRHPNFSFHHVDRHGGLSCAENPLETGHAAFPLPDGCADRIFLFSLFTHMSEEQVMAYLREFARVLEPGGRILASLFVYDDEVLRSSRQSNTGGWNLFFEHEIGEGVRANSMKSSHSPIAFHNDTIRRMVAACGLDAIHYLPGAWSGHHPVAHDGQDMIVLTNKAG